jgi:hypothetical protein
LKTWSRLTKIDKPKPVEIFIPHSDLNEWQLFSENPYIYIDNYGLLKIFARNATCLKTGIKGIICYEH